VANIIEKQARRWTYEEYYKLDDGRRYEIIFTRWEDEPKSGRGILPKKRKPQMDTDEHRFSGKKSFSRWVTAVSLATHSDLC
jgi:hypothetical protein